MEPAEADDPSYPGRVSLHRHGRGFFMSGKNEGGEIIWPYHVNRK